MNGNHVSKVAIVGAGGNVGRFMTEQLLATGKHSVTAITRSDSNSTFPEGVAVAKVDYDDSSTLVKALRGQEALVITISGRASTQVIEEKLIRAAAEADVRWILPNVWSPDPDHEGIVKDIPMFGTSVTSRKLIESIGKSSHISVVTGFWYEWSLAVPANYGFDFSSRSATFFDNGDTKISTSTWPQIGRAVAAILSLPLHATGSELCLASLTNKVVYINSFTVSQRDMLDSALRVTGSNEADWTVVKVPARERFATGVREVQEGNMAGYSKLCARIFFDDGCGDFETNKGTLNTALELPTEKIDEFTKIAIERQSTASQHH